MKLPLLLVTALLLAGCDAGEWDDFQVDFHYQYDVQPGGRLEIDNANGSVEIEGWDRNSVEISGVKFASSRRSLDAVHIDIRNDRDSIAIRTSRPSFQRGGARYRIRVPRGIAIDRVNTTNGPILLRNLEGYMQAHLRTVNGSIEAENIHGGLDAQTVNGRIELRDIDGGVTLRTSNGRIDAERIHGACEAHTTNGAITIMLDQSADSPLKATTTNAPIELTFRERPSDAIRAETTNGSITLRLPGDSGAHLRADSRHAPITTDFEVSEHFDGTFHAHNHVDGVLGQGGPEIQLATSNGHIKIFRSL